MATRTIADAMQCEMQALEWRSKLPNHFDRCCYARMLPVPHASSTSAPLAKWALLLATQFMILWQKLLHCATMHLQLLSQYHPRWDYSWRGVVWTCEVGCMRSVKMHSQRHTRRT